MSAVAACASSSSPDGTERTIFGDSSIGGKLFYRVHTDEPVDLIIWFRNTSGQSARLRELSLAGASGAVRTISANVYSLERIGYNPATAVGILSKECPSKFVPKPVSSLTVPGHDESDWIGVIALRVTRPGTYLIQRIKFSYSEGTNRYWQYYNDPVSLMVSDPPMPGPRPLPPSAVCT
jgi:hypothetical protein